MNKLRPILKGWEGSNMENQFEPFQFPKKRTKFPPLEKMTTFRQSINSCPKPEKPEGHDKLQITKNEENEIKQ